MAMSRVSMTTVFFTLSRRMHSVSPGALSGAPTVRAAAKSVAAEGSSAAAKEVVFWMRDPKTGNWLPENQFDEVDPVELRAELLSKK